MAIPHSGAWKGLLVCPDRNISVSIALDVSPDGTLHGEYSITDSAYSPDTIAGTLRGTYADNLVTFVVAGDVGYTASFHGEVHPALPPPKHDQVLFGYATVYRGGVAEAGILVLFSGVHEEARGGWNA